MTSPTCLTDLPIEVIALILYPYLSLCELANIRLQNKHLKAITDDIIHKSYRKAIRTAALVDSPYNVPVLERFAKFKRRENAWTHFNHGDKGGYVPEITFRNIHYLTRKPMCDFNGNYFLMGVPGLGAQAITAIYYCRLPSGDQFPPPEWHTVLCSNTGAPKSTFRRWHQPSDERSESEQDDDLEPLGTEISLANSEQDSNFIDDAGTGSSSSSESGSEENAVPSALLIDDAQMSYNSAVGTDMNDIDARTNSTDSGSRSDCDVSVDAADEDAMMDFIDWDGGSADPSDVKKSPRPMTKPRWVHLPFLFRLQGEILGFKLAMEESNLLVLVTFESSGNVASKYHLYLCYFPSGHAHPSAALSHIDIMVDATIFDNCCIRLLNGKLGILLSTFDTDQNDKSNADRFFLFDWRSGVLLMKKMAEAWETFYRFSFLSDDVIIFPNTQEWHIEICNINADVSASPCTIDQDYPKTLTTALILELPELQSTTQLWEFGCDTEQPASTSLHDDDDDDDTADSPSFQSLFADGLVVFSFTMEYHFQNVNANNSDVRFVIHKQALLELLSHSSPSVANMTIQSLSNETLHMGWSEWGPSRTRWFDIHGGSADFSPVTWGQRVVSIPAKYAHVSYCPVYVYNFNPAAVSAATSDASVEVVTSLDPFYLNEDWGRLESQVAFQETVWSQLPYIKSVSPFQFGRISGAMMDGDRIVLLRSAEGILTEIDWLIVLHMA